MSKWDQLSPTITRTDNETAYSYQFGENASSYTQYYTAPVGPNVVEQGSYEVYSEQRVDCYITFYADKSGIITRYVMDPRPYTNSRGCNYYLTSWGGPAARSSWL